MIRPRTKKLVPTLLAVVAVLALVAVPGVARAGKISSGFLLSSNATRMGCILFNAGPSAVKVTSAKILLTTGFPNTEYESCTASPLQPGKSCSVSGNGQALAGQIQVEGITKHLRGTCMLLTAGNNILAVTEMR